MLRRLTEMLFIQGVRVWIELQAPATGGWLVALRDPPVRTALGLIHQSPDRAWKVAELAEAVGLSRSAFSARFTLLVGEAPIKYLVHWRMQRAARLLKDEGTPASIAQHFRYASEVAFRKAFKREVGIPPGRFRRQENNPNRRLRLE
jgi:AraC-like DNA-binding protein